MDIIVHTDGASRGNPGPSAVAYIIKGLEDGPIEYGKTIGITSNNQAEYRALLSALERLNSLNPKASTITIYSDSELMVRQINGEYKVKNADLRPIFTAAQDEISRLRGNDNEFEIIAVRREENQQADKLANKALDQQSE